MTPEKTSNILKRLRRKQIPYIIAEVHYQGKQPWGPLRLRAYDIKEDYGNGKIRPLGMVDARTARGARSLGRDI